VGHWFELPRLTLTRRPGHRAASWAHQGRADAARPAGHQHGFGKGNFKALFEAIEREQARRGNL
jgi:hypothetical protein